MLLQFLSLLSLIIENWPLHVHLTPSVFLSSSCCNNLLYLQLHAYIFALSCKWLMEVFQMHHYGFRLQRTLKEIDCRLQLLWSQTCLLESKLLCKECFVWVVLIQQTIRTTLLERLVTRKFSVLKAYFISWVVPTEGLKLRSIIVLTLFHLKPQKLYD